ncbi:MAG: hypothetical protein PUC33_04040 [Oscillospiraceae bacterium]|nr:hypothetical protein [Oscillospiraceae bacterium]
MKKSVSCWILYGIFSIITLIECIQFFLLFGDWYEVIFDFKALCGLIAFFGTFVQAFFVIIPYYHFHHRFYYTIFMQKKAQYELDFFDKLSPPGIPAGVAIHGKITPESPA